MTPVYHLQFMEKTTFSEAWKRAAPQSSAGFEEDVFWRSLYPHARGFARLMWRFWPGYFQRDLELIRRLAVVTSGQEVRFEVDNFRYQHPESGLFRRGLRLRVSGKRLINLARRVMKDQGTPDYSLT
jgi:hypothetical protein